MVSCFRAHQDAGDNDCTARGDGMWVNLRLISEFRPFADIRLFKPFSHGVKKILLCLVACNI